MRTRSRPVGPGSDGVGDDPRVIEPHFREVVRRERGHPTGFLERFRIDVADRATAIRGADVAALVPVRVVVEADEPLDGHLETDLLLHLANAGLRGGFPALDHATGEDPVSFEGRVGAFEQQDLALDEHHAVGRQRAQLLRIHARRQTREAFQPSGNPGGPR